MVVVVVVVVVVVLMVLVVVVLVVGGGGGGGGGRGGGGGLWWWVTAAALTGPRDPYLYGITLPWPLSRASSIGVKMRHASLSSSLRTKCSCSPCSAM